MRNRIVAFGSFSLGVVSTLVAFIIFSGIHTSTFAQAQGGFVGFANDFRPKVPTAFIPLHPR
jgi:hypothetical protein